MCVWDFRKFEYVLHEHAQIISNPLEINPSKANRVFGTTLHRPSLVPGQNSWVSGAAGNHESAEVSSGGARMLETWTLWMSSQKQMMDGWHWMMDE